MKLGVCWYPEQWPREQWRGDVARMRELGIGVVRIGEFAWSRIEPEPGRLDWEWLDAALEVLADARLSVVLGTPTATPPKWLVDRSPEILAVDEAGGRRGFGSRRHYCFSSTVYRRESERIVRLLAERYAAHPAVVAWQLDNEYGCHDTVASYSADARAAFRQWLHRRHGNIEALNRAWGTAFWSQEYRGFEEIDPPIATVTEAHPAHRLDYRRFASDEVAEYNLLQVRTLQDAGVRQPLLHNYMGFFTGFDAFRTGRALDIATWDSYPLGFLEQGFFDDRVKARYRRQGHPDIAAFHHDLYRAVGRGRWWVMEQQPGPVNWARYNPAPLPGIVRLWTWEACAHGAEVVSYFRWRQARYGQEQMHSGLRQPDDSPAAAWPEVARVAAELDELGELPPSEPAPVALVFDYESIWSVDIQPQGESYDALELVFRVYEGLRRLGVDVDMVAPDASLAPYRAVAVPCLTMVSDDFAQALADYSGSVLLGPRSGSRTTDFSIPETLPPGVLRALMPITVQCVESLRPGIEEAVAMPGAAGAAMQRWREHVTGDVAVAARFEDGSPALVGHERRRYIAGWPNPALLGAVLKQFCEDAGVATVALPESLRLRTRGDLRFAFNHGRQVQFVPAGDRARFLLGERRLRPAEVAVWREEDD